ncbi:hypothetical protein, partial [Streptomyces sp. LUP47B]|uniref:hypothetical protein n=1 Tax=Streptomyces sp. LUP47B TaxID=1890286 RepID=UPI001C407ED0
RFALPPAAEYSLRSFRASPREKQAASSGGLLNWPPAISINLRSSGTGKEAERVCASGTKLGDAELCCVGGEFGYGLVDKLRVRHVFYLGQGLERNLRFPWKRRELNGVP